MKYKDYYSALGIDRNASAADIKAAYRKLARKFHPDVSKEAGAEEKFKEVSEAYKTLKDPEKRKAYDQLGTHQAGQEFKPPPDWGQQFRHGPGGASFSFDDIDLSDLFSAFAGGGARGTGRSRSAAMPGQDYEVTTHISLEDAFRGAVMDLNLTAPEYDERGQLHRVPQTFKVRIAKGATEGQRLRLPGKGGKGFNGGRNGDLYLNIVLHPHPLFRAAGHDLYLDLPLAPWEAALGASIEVPTLGGPVVLKVPPGTSGGQKLRLSGRGLPRPREGTGDLYAIVQIVVPTVLSERDRALFKELGDASTFNPRGHFAAEMNHAH